MSESAKETAVAGDEECLHCTYADALSVINDRLTAEGKQPGASAVVQALLAMAGDLIAEAPEGCRAGILVEAVRLLAERSGGRLTVQDVPNRAGAFPPARRVH